MTLHFSAFTAPFRVGSGYLAVDLFFLMSGFVLAHAYEDRLSGHPGAVRFLLLRFVRLYPLYLLSTLIAVAVPTVGLLSGMSRVWRWDTLAVAAIPALAMLPSPPMAGGSSMLYPMNFPAWSLAYELLVNFAYALMLRVRAVREADAVLLLIVLVAGMVLVALAATGGSLDGGLLWGTVHVGLARVVFSFFAGAVICRMYRRGLPKLSIPVPVALVVIGMLLCVDPGSWRRPYDLTCVLIVFPVVLWLCVCSEPVRFPRAYTVLGLISYPLYAIHVPCRYLVERIADRFFGAQMVDHAPWIGMIVIAVLCVLSAVLSIVYDAPARRWLSRLIGQ